jgi:hypothetical protein
LNHDNLGILRVKDLSMRKEQLLGNKSFLPK